MNTRIEQPKAPQPKIAELQGLTGLFETNYAQYKSSNYDESNTRTDFIDKFFTLFDWDISNSNSQGFLKCTAK